LFIITILLNSKPLVNKMDLRPLVERHVDSVRRFSIEKLANILYDCVEWAGQGSRNETDWLTAEEYIDKTSNDSQMRQFTRKFLIMAAYEELRKDNPDAYKGAIEHTAQGVLSELPSEQLDSLFDRITPEKARDYQHLFLGRDIWNAFYQPLRQEHWNANTLKTKGYGKILFM